MRAIVWSSRPCGTSADPCASVSTEHLPNVVKQISETGDGKTIGIPLKEQNKGKIVDEWKKA